MRKNLSLIACLTLLLVAAPTLAATKIALDQPAPEILAKTLDGQSVTLESLRGKPVILQFASLTEPTFRLRTPLIEKLAAKYDGKAVFIILYQRESHPADTDQAIEINSPDFALAKPTSQTERITLAKQALDRLTIKSETLLVDDWSDSSALSYGNYPNMTFIIDAKGNLVAGYPWMDPTKVKNAIDTLFAGKPLPSDLRGSVHPYKPGDLDYSATAMNMTGTQGPQAIGIVIDHLKLTDDQKTAIYPALATFLVDVRNLRETQGILPNKAGAAVAPATQPKAIDPEELKTGIQKVRAGAQHLIEVCKKNLSEKDAATIMSTLDQGPAHRLFAQ